jgi:hypothetical protein
MYVLYKIKLLLWIFVEIAIYEITLFAVQIFIDGCFVINKFAVVDTE